MDSIDDKQVYNTNALVKRTGRAIAICLKDACLPGEVKNKHMTILFRRHQKWSNDEVSEIAKAADNWIRTQYGTNQAPVLFTISPASASRDSATIHSDLFTLCMHLREQFKGLTEDEQRPPHVKLFKKYSVPKPKRKPNRKPCAKKQEKQRLKLSGRLNRMLAQIESLRQAKVAELESLQLKESQLQSLLASVSASDFDAKKVKSDIKLIAKSHKDRHVSRKHRFKRMSKEKRQQRKIERKFAREQRKKMKEQRAATMEAARVDRLPLYRAQIGEQDTLEIHVDGYNILGCDAECRKLIRKGRGGNRKARERVAMLLQTRFVGRVHELQFEYGKVHVTVWFDGCKRGEKRLKDVVNGLDVVFSGKGEIVDDLLVKKFGNKPKQSNANVMVVTSDRDLTMRLFECGVKVMKSGCFYKQYLMIDADKTKDGVGSGVGGVEDTKGADGDDDMVLDDDEKDTFDGPDGDDTDEDARIASVIEDKVTKFLTQEAGEETMTDEESDGTPDLGETDGDDDDDDEVEGPGKCAVTDDFEMADAE